MSRSVLYVSAPLRPTEEEIVRHTMAEIAAEIDALRPHPDLGLPFMAPGIRKRSAPTELALRANLERAMRWLSWLRRSFPETTFIAPWIAIVLSGADDSNPVVRERAMQDNFAVIERCDGIVLCGPRISEGMRREMEQGQMRHKIWIDPYQADQTFRVYDVTRFLLDLPHPEAPGAPHGRSFQVWFDQVSPT